MRLHELQPAEGSKKNRKRVGRGIGSGHGKTSTRGHKGQKSRSGGGVRPGFEGGQMPLQQRVPKRGFTNIFKKEYALLNVEQLNKFEDGTIVTPELVREVGLVKSMKDGLKILGGGELTKSLTVQGHRFTGSAVEKITAAGGKTEVI